MSRDEVINAALALPAESKAELADILLASLDDAAQGEIDAAWAKEAENRIDAFERGEVPTDAGPDVLRELRERKRQ